MAITKADAKWIFGIAVTWLTGLWVIWTYKITEELIVPLLKLVFSLFLTIAIAIAVYMIIFKKEKAKDVKKK